MAKDVSYIGDGVYAQWDGERIILTAGGTDNEKNKIYLEAATWNGLMEFFRRKTGQGTRHILLANVAPGATEDEIRKAVNDLLDERDSDQKLM